MRRDERLYEIEDVIYREDEVINWVLYYLKLCSMCFRLLIDLWDIRFIDLYIVFFTSINVGL